MNKPLKIFLIVVVVLVALVVLPVLALVLLVDPNSFKPQIIAAVKQQTGREFRIDGKLGWTFYPVLGIELGRSQLGNAQGFGDKPMVAVERVAVGVELLPLLEREINVSQLLLENPQIDLGIDKSGRSNWDDILELQKHNKATASAQASSPATPASSAPPVAGTASTPPLRIAISGITISDGAVNWRDAKNAQNVQLSKLMLKTGAINPLKPVDVAISMDVNSAAPAVTADITLSSSVLFDTVTQLLTLQQTELHVNLTGKDIPAGKQKLALKTGTVTANLDKQTLVVPALYVDIGNAELKASIDGHNIIDKPQFGGQLSLAEISLRKMLGDLGIALPAMADDKTLTKFSFASTYSATPARVELQQIKTTLDDSIISGKLQANLGDITHVSFELALDAINADRYLAPPTVTPATTTPSAAGSTAAATVNDSETFAALDTLALNGKFGIGKLHVQNLDLADVEVNLKTEGRTVVIDPLKASLYEGKTVVTVNMDGRNPRAQSQAQVLLLGLNIGNFLDAFLQKRGPVEGNGNIVANVSFTGLAGDAIISSATGGGKVLLANGAVRGFNIAQEIRNAQALVKGKPKQDAPKKTDFTELLIPFTIDKGVLSWQDMTASSPLLRIGSKGDFNLLTQQVDTSVDASIVSTLKGQGGDPLNELAGFLVPVKVKGAMNDPKISIDFKKVLAQTALGDKQKALEAKVDERKDELKQKADDKKEEVKKKAGDELKRGLDRLFNKKKD